MKKVVSILALLCLVMALTAGTAMAAETESTDGSIDENLTISEPDASNADDELYPIDVIQSEDNEEIRKIYELSPNTDPGLLPREDFEREGYIYSYTDILREVIIGEENKIITQTETVESTKNDLATILGLLPQNKEVVTEDGFTGTLLLNTATIKTEASSYGSGSKAITTTRKYPNLSDADTQYIPKTIESDGRTLTLTDVQWQTDNTMNVDDYEIADRYTAIATYSGTQTYSYVKTYTTTADYSGEVYKAGTVAIRYSVIFAGVKKPPAETLPPSAAPHVDRVDGGDLPADGTATNDRSSSWSSWAIPIGALLLGASAVLIILAMKKRKEKTQYEEVPYNDSSYSYGADADDYTDPGDGI